MTTYFFGIERLPIETRYGNDFVKYKDELIPCDKITDAIEQQVIFDYDLSDDEIVDDYVFWSWIDNSTEDQIIDFVDTIYRLRDVDSGKI